MPTVEELDELRYRLLEAAYDASVSGETRRGWLDWQEWGNREGLDRRTASEAALWLIDRDFAIKPAMAPMIAITPAGADKVESRRRPQQPDPGATVLLTVVEARLIEPALAEVRTFIDTWEERLDLDDLADLRAQIKTIEAQQRSPRPRRSVMAAAVGALRWTTEQAAAGIAGNYAFAALGKLAQVLGL